MLDQGPGGLGNMADIGADDRQHADARAQFDAVDIGDHVALFYDSQESQLRMAAAFIANALRRGHRCLYLTDANSPDVVGEWFRDAGIDVEARVDAGDLSIRSAAAVYLDDGFDPDRIVESLADAAAESDADDYAGLSVAGENSWCFRTDETFDRIVEFEAKFDARSDDFAATTLCQYDLDDFDEESIAKAIQTHEHIVYRGTLCRNPYYLPPEEYGGADSTPSVALMLEQTYSLARSQREIERREQRLSVVNRILRHDIRNDLNVVLGNLDRVRDTTALTEEARECLATIERVTARLVDRAEKARYVQQTLTDSAVERIDLSAALDTAVEVVRDAHPAATITLDDEACPAVLADSHLETALIELLTNAVVHQSADEPSATVTVSRTDDIVTIEVVNPGPPIPEQDRQALVQDIETPLEHGDGLGLWLVKWIVDNSGGTLRFPTSETDREECRIAIDLHVIDGR